MTAAAIYLAPPQPGDLAELLRFEFDNRAYFESMINARPADFYSEEGVAASIETARREAAQDVGHQYLVRAADGAILGRLNFMRVRRAHFHSAEVGYRFAQDACGRGVATEAVRQALALAFGPLDLKRLEAIARPENVGSCKVLERNGFVAFGRSQRSMELGGAWYDRIYYERHATEAVGLSSL